MKKTIEDFNLDGQRVIIRCDLNVPIKNGVIVDDNRILMSLETINYATSHGAKVILLSHLGRVETNEDKEKNTLYPVYLRLKELVSSNIIFHNDTRNLDDAVSNLKNGEILLIENTRFEDIDGKKESKCDMDLAKYWSSFGDIYINDAYGSSHRAHASTYGIPTFIPNGVGFLVSKEVVALDNVINANKKPFIVILGGAKVFDKIGVIENLVKKADYILIGGGMAYTFLKAQGYNIGKSLLDTESIEFAKKIITDYKEKIVLPLDVVTGLEYKPDTISRNCLINKISDDEMGLDISNLTIDLFSDYIKNAKTIIWNGPVGVFEFEKFSNGTKEICKLLANSDADVLIGGGDSAAACIKFGYKHSYYHISTGGGATLEYLEGKDLPGISVISNK